ncbi:hypothetical protein P355_0467 [Burkholderia cenocepacia KC-01]|nr:hypothetical protein P355_0467 [Burkholderia cenocepacia KC-01]
MNPVLAVQDQMAVRTSHYRRSLSQAASTIRIGIVAKDKGRGMPLIRGQTRIDGRTVCVDRVAQRTESLPVPHAVRSGRVHTQIESASGRGLRIRIGRHRTAAHTGHHRHRRRHRRPHRGIRLRFRTHPRGFGRRRPCTRRRVPDGAITLVHADCLCREKGEKDAPRPQMPMY